MENFSISTDPAKMCLDVIHGFLTQAYWCKGISREKVQSAIEHSLNFGIFLGEAQVGYARVITDYTTIAYLGDVFVLEAHRGQGASKMLMQAIHSEPRLRGLRRWILLTRDAHTLYEQFGWKPIADPARWMEIHDPLVYQH